MSAPIARLFNWVNDKLAAVKITASRMDAEFDQIIAALNQKAIIKTTAPSSPIAGMIWYDSTNLLLKVYSGSDWGVVRIDGKGADVASAASMTLGNDGNFFDITGTTNITSITAKSAAFVAYLQFDGVLTLTNGNNLKLQGDFVTAAGSTVVLISDGTNWWEVSRQPSFLPSASNALTGSVVQVVNYQTGAYATCATDMVWDDTIPQNTEGDQVLSLAITPKSATNKLRIDVVVNGYAANAKAIAALFQDSTADALAAAYQACYGEIGQNVAFTYYMDAGTTSETTFKVRAGSPNPVTFYLNGDNSTRMLGGVSISSITITEIKV